MKPDRPSVLNSDQHLSEELFRQIRDVIHQDSGLYFSDKSKFLLERRLGQRLALLGFESFRRYYHYLLYDPKRVEELQEIYNLITTNETYFFREMSQLQAFHEEILPELHERNARSRRLRIWSAGCSSGEEPYTIAMLIQETGRFQGWDVEIFATDINQLVLQRAREGVYREASFRATSDEHRERYFTREPDGRFRIVDGVRKLVSFGHLNLYQDRKLPLMMGFDVIFCRNVIIYFNQPAKARVVETFHHKLREEGYLLLGHSETLINISDKFKLRHLTHDMVYQR